MTRVSCVRPFCAIRIARGEFASFRAFPLILYEIAPREKLALLLI